MGWRGLKADVATALALALVAGTPGSAQALTSPGCLAGGRLVTVTAVTTALEIVIGDDASVSLAGIDPDGGPMDGSGDGAQLA